MTNAYASYYRPHSDTRTCPVCKTASAPPRPGPELWTKWTFWWMKRRTKLDWLRHSPGLWCSICPGKVCNPLTPTNMTSIFIFCHSATYNVARIYWTARRKLSYVQFMLQAASVILYVFIDTLCIWWYFMYFVILCVILYVFVIILLQSPARHKVVTCHSHECVSRSCWVYLRGFASLGDRVRNHSIHLPAQSDDCSFAEADE